MKKTVCALRQRYFGFYFFQKRKNFKHKNIKAKSRKDIVCLFFFQFSFYALFHYSAWSAFDSSHFDPLVNIHTTGQTWSYFHFK